MFEFLMKFFRKEKPIVQKTEEHVSSRLPHDTPIYHDVAVVPEPQQEPPVELPIAKPEYEDEPGPQLPDHGSPRKIRLGLIVGHTEKQPGAKLLGTDTHEYHYNKEVMLKATEMAKDRSDIEVVGVLRDGISIQEAYAKIKTLHCDAVIELHFNAGGAQGTETLTTIEQVDKDFAREIHWGLCRMLERQGDSRGVKCISLSARGGVNVHSMPGSANCLVEPFFGDNAEEVLQYGDKQELIASSLLASTILWAKKVHLL